MVEKEITVDSEIRLVKPNPKKDAATTLLWLKGEHGRETMRLMGCIVPDNYEPTIKTETKRLKLMTKSKDEVIRMIEYKGKIVGTMEIWRVQYDYVPAPSISILIGSPLMRGLSLGTKILKAIENIVLELGNEVAYTRTLLSNINSAIFFEQNGFAKAGAPYSDEYGLVWQNYQKKLK